MGTILAHAAIPFHLAHLDHGTSLLPTSILQSIRHTDLPLPPTTHPVPHPGLQPTGLLAIPQTYQALPASGPLYLLCSLPRIFSHRISTWRFPHLQQISVPMSHKRHSQTSLSPIAALSPSSFPCFIFLYST